MPTQEMTMLMPNQAAPVNAPIASWFHCGHTWRRVTEQHRWAAMRPAILLSFLLLSGCHCQSVKSVRAVADVTGTNELVLYDSVTPWLLGNGEDHEFHSLVWRFKSGTNWTERANISRGAFLAGTTRDRWVIDIDSLD